MAEFLDYLYNLCQTANQKYSKKKTEEFKLKIGSFIKIRGNICHLQL